MHVSRILSAAPLLTNCAFTVLRQTTRETGMFRKSLVATSVGKDVLFRHGRPQPAVHRCVCALKPDESSIGSERKGEKMRRTKGKDASEVVSEWMKMLFWGYLKQLCVETVAAIPSCSRLCLLVPRIPVANYALLDFSAIFFKYYSICRP